MSDAKTVVLDQMAKGYADAQEEIQRLRKQVSELQAERDAAQPRLRLVDLYKLKHLEEHTLDFGRFSITVQRRVEDWMVYLNGNKKDWTRHEQLDYAVGYMLLTYYDRLAETNT